MCTFQCRGACEGLALGFLIWIFKPPYLDPVFFFFFSLLSNFLHFSFFVPFSFLLLPSPLLWKEGESKKRERECMCRHAYTQKHLRCYSQCLW